MAENLLLAVELCESSSSDDDIENALLLHYLKEARPKIKNYIQIINEYSDKEFQRNFRIQRHTYRKLKNLYEKSEFFCHHKNAISADQALLGFLWFAGNKTCIRDVASRFDMAESTFHKYSDNVMDFFNHIAKSVIKFPETLDEKIKISTEFTNINGFPGILGCIDGTYIPIRTPAHKIKSTYVNRHDFPSLTLQAICDSNKMFLDVFTGPPSKVHDARIFKLSFISTLLPNACGDQWHILGDAAYPLKKYLITPYRNYGDLTESQKNFNYKFSSCRVKIENAFGLLKSRFRQLIKLDYCTVQRSCIFIIACCTMHNLCLQLGDDLDDSMLEEIDIGNIAHGEPINGDENRIEGEQKRNMLCQLLQ